MIRVLIVASSSGVPGRQLSPACAFYHYRTRCPCAGPPKQSNSPTAGCQLWRPANLGDHLVQASLPRLRNFWID